MKRTVGIILLIISGLNLVAIANRASQGDSLGSPIYLVLIVMMFFGGISILMSSGKKADSTEVQKTQDE